MLPSCLRLRGVCVLYRGTAFLHVFLYNVFAWCFCVLCFCSLQWNCVFAWHFCCLQENCACMVFVRTLELSKAIQHWIENHPILKTLQPGRVTGTRRGLDDGGQYGEFPMYSVLG